MGNQLKEEDYFFKRRNDICDKLTTLRAIFPDELNSGEYNFKGGSLNSYCPNRNCNEDINKICAGCLWLFNQLYNDSTDFSNNANDNIYIVTYILGWLSYKLNQKTENGIDKLMDFYNKHMKNVDRYKKSIENPTEYKTYIDIINKNMELMDIDIKIMSKFYDAFNNMCKMYNELSKSRTNSEEYLKYVNNFAKNYNTLFNETSGNLFKRVLPAVSNDYNYIKSILNVEYIRNQFPELQKEKKAQVSESSPKGTQIDDSSSETSKAISETKIPGSEAKVSDSEIKLSDPETTIYSSLVINKLIPIPFILVATLILLGITYKVNNKTIKKYIQH
ncbi:putative bir1 protein [Plasmodium yoelii yoelii]|uniref:Bir1 protein n=1 Tax=Plasmodium yoelii yoelii TaxID=73239 RepID=Q7RIQ1_PLAYO|nr:putative bir1 protein [Plasmodium yoelii yoelii]